MKHDAVSASIFVESVSLCHRVVVGRDVNRHTRSLCLFPTAVTFDGFTCERRLPILRIVRKLNLTDEVTRTLGHDERGTGNA
jgi:hypothetical protein